jgi:hypothetical protein
MTISVRKALLSGLIGGSAATLIVPISWAFAVSVTDMIQHTGNHGEFFWSGLGGLFMVAGTIGLVLGALFGLVVGGPIILLAHRFEKHAQLFVVTAGFLVGVSVGIGIGTSLQQSELLTRYLLTGALAGTLCSLVAWRFSYSRERAL